MSSHSNQLGSQEGSARGKRLVVYLRFPFKRNGFKDPIPAVWNSEKEKRLWELLSQSDNRSEIDWSSLARQFDVPVAYALQQAAWLYEKELEQVRAQMQKVNLKGNMNEMEMLPARAPSTATPAEETTMPVDRQAFRAAVFSNNTSYQWSFNSNQHSMNLQPTTTETGPGDGEDDESEQEQDHEKEYMQKSQQLLSKSRKLNVDGPSPEDSGSFDDGFINTEDEEPAFLPVGNKSQKGSQLLTADRKDTYTESSSFTDLSDVSISKSALEEALMYDLEKSSK
ncbi:hypothetical protein TRVA0_014S01530 [Trichomonascus vanleenenianus]|uniref:Atg29p n=1 Tax=Trichomonascus vanleenenianus TaxID=2268995 RepID=UPI003ECA15EF